MKVLIADDEANIRNGLRKQIDWIKLGFDEVFTAGDGLEALQIFKENCPEIVITDIVMPGLDGLNLCEKIREISKSTCIILLSGHSEFEYARKAMRMEITEYQLKPVNLKELEKIVSSAVARFNKEKKSNEDREKDNCIYREKLIDDILLGRINDPEILKEINGKTFQMRGQYGICVFTMEIDCWGALNSSFDKQKKNEMFIEIKRQVSEGLKDRKYILFQKYDHSYTIICDNEHLRDITDNKNFIKNLAKTINLSLQKRGASISIGFAGYDNFAGIPNLYKKSVACLTHKLYMGSGKVIFFNEIEGTADNDYLVQIDEKELIGSIQRLDYESCSEIITKLLIRLEEQKCTKAEVVRNICSVCKNLLVMTLNENGSQVEDIFGRNLSYISEIPDYDTIEKYREWVQGLYFLVIKELSDIKGVRHNAVILKALAYIKKNYNTELPVEAVSNHIQKSPDYFSRIFKREVGMPFSEYLNRIRINEAKKLMKNTNFLAYEISDKVGFQDYKYFVQVFRKIEGVSPSEFRKGKSV